RIPPIDQGSFCIEQTGRSIDVFSQPQKGTYLPGQLSSADAPPGSDVLVRQMMDRKLLQVRNADELLQPALGVWVGPGGADQVISAAVRRHQETTRSDCLAELILCQRIARGMLVGEECEGV